MDKAINYAPIVQSNKTAENWKMEIQSVQLPAVLLFLFGYQAQALS
jgi:hypothetical protein